jgi:cell division septation protein DedD
MKSPLRHPLTALLLLALVAAILLPFWQREQGAPRRALDMELPPLPELPEKDASAPVSADELRQAEADIHAAREQAGQAGSTALTADADAEALPVPAAWAVEVAILESEQQARSELQALLDAGYRAFLRPLAEDNRWQLFAGPELERERAEQTRAQLRYDQRIGEQQQVVPFRP